MSSFVIAPKPKRLLSPKRVDVTDEKKRIFDPVKSFTFFDGRETLTSGSPDASREVERIMHTGERSPCRQKYCYVQVKSSPPLRSISPPARAQNPQAAAAEAYWREHREILGTKQERQRDVDSPIGGRDREHEKDDDDELQFCHSLPLTSQNHSLFEPGSPFSAPPALPSLELARHYSVAQSDTPNRSELEEDDIEGTILLSPNFYGEMERGSRLEIFTPPVLTDYSPYHLPIVNSPGDTCQLTTDTRQSPNIMVSRPIDIPSPASLNRGQSLPSRAATSLSTTPGINSKRKRGKPKYASQSLPSAVGADLYLQIRRAVRTQSDAI